MTKSKQDASLNEAQQTALALEWFSAMWDNAIERGVPSEHMAIVCISATTRKLVDVYGKDQTIALLSAACDNITNNALTNTPTDAN